MPELGAFESGVLLELVKDMLYQAYVRKGKLQQAMMVRRFFAEAPAVSAGVARTGPY